QPRRIAALCQMPIGAHETLSDRIRRRVGIPEHTRCEAKQTRLISPDENPERLPIASEHPGDYVGVFIHHYRDPRGGVLVTVSAAFLVLRSDRSQPGPRCQRWPLQRPPACAEHDAGTPGRRSRAEAAP